ncbi:MAG TPA: Spy/CpxP family protein refolding chaperone [Candidatus Limnocylindrales bacterium]|jgi:Spy/CpxP family protein refolding chaperone|nr:Spy/CpxP family protein refolding chaperone [Candidatus Limnocylindrales bacterium]
MRIRKFSLLAALALGALLSSTSTSSAQSTSAQSTNAAARGTRGGSVQQRVDRMASELNLTPEQKTKVTALFEQESKKRQELRADTTLSREEKREKGRAMMAEQEKKLKAILTPEQTEKWQKMREQFRPRQQQSKPSEKKAE